MESSSQLRWCFCAAAAKGVRSQAAHNGKLPAAVDPLSASAPRLQDRDYPDLPHKAVLRAPQLSGDPMDPLRRLPLTCYHCILENLL